MKVRDKACLRLPATRSVGVLGRSLPSSVNSRRATQSKCCGQMQNRRCATPSNKTSVQLPRLRPSHMHQRSLRAARLQTANASLRSQLRSSSSSEDDHAGAVADSLALKGRQLVVFFFFSKNIQLACLCKVAVSSTRVRSDGRDVKWSLLAWAARQRTSAGRRKGHWGNDFPAPFQETGPLSCEFLAELAVATGGVLLGAANPLGCGRRLQADQLMPRMYL